MPPNSVVALFDANTDIFYIKSSDAGGFSTVKAYEFKEVQAEQATEYVTRKEFNELLKSLGGLGNEQYSQSD